MSIHIGSIKEVFELAPEIFVSDIVGVLKRIDKRRNIRNEEYLDIDISDKTGTLNIKVWNDVLPRIQLNTLKQGVVVKVSGRISVYQNNKYITADMITPLKEGEYDPSKLYILTQKDIDRMWIELLEYVEDINSIKLKNTLARLFSSSWGEKFKYAPAAAIVHHNYRGGLLEHTLEVLKMSLSLYSHYKDYANRDVIIAGAILHDIGKIIEYAEGENGYYSTQVGMLIGHIVLGVNLFLEFWGKTEGEETKHDVTLRDHIIHIILSHHTELEYGAVVRPATVEAAIVAQADMASSKIKQFAQEYEKLGTTSNISQYNKYIKTHVIKVLPSEMAQIEE